MVIDISKPDFSKTPYFGVDPHIKILDYPLNELTEPNFLIKMSSNAPYVTLDARKSFGAAMSVLVPVNGSFEKSPAVKNGCFCDFLKSGFLILRITVERVLIIKTSNFGYL